MSDQAKQKVRDPLAAARAQLDFAAIARDAPSVRDIIFKSQTIVPLAPAKPWWRIGTTAAALLLLALLAAVPWIPRHAALSVLQLSFEQQFTPGQAQDVALGMLKSLPSWVLLDAQYDDNGGAQLQLNASALCPEPELYGVVEQALGEQSGLAAYPLVKTVLAEASRQWRSPLAVGREWLAGDGNTQSAQSGGQALVDQVLAAEALYTQGLRARLAVEYFELRRFDFLPSGAVREVPYDFYLDCWPARAGILLNGYPSLTRVEQETARRISREYLATVNLLNATVLLSTEPTSWLPIVVQVYRPGLVADGGVGLDTKLSERLQAHLTQPTADELGDVKLREVVEQRVSKAMQDCLPGWEYRADYQVRRTPGSGDRNPRYLVALTLTGRTPNSLSRPAPDGLDDDDSLEY